VGFGFRFGRRLTAPLTFILSRRGREGERKFRRVGGEGRWKDFNSTPHPETLPLVERGDLQK